MKHIAGYAIALAIGVHGWLGWSVDRYAFEMIDDDSLVRMNTLTGDFSVCALRGAFLSGERSVVCAEEYAANE